MSKWFPNLKVAEPAAYAEIMRVQNFSGEQWLSRLAQLTNFNKHNALSELEWSDFESYLVGEGDACLRFGELGFSAVEVEPGGALRFVNSGEVACEINGPDALDPKTLEGRLDGRIVRKEKRRMLRIRDSGHSLAHEIWVISKNVYRFIDKICSSLT